MPGLSEVVASNLRRCREHAGLSLGDVAEAASIAKSTMHALERGESNPTLNTLWSLATALGVGLGELVEQRTDSTVVVRAAEGTRVDGDGICARLIHRGEAGLIEILELTIGQRQSRPHRAGVMEFLFVVSGQVDAGPIDSRVRLGPGDFLAFDGARSHMYCAVGQSARALIIMSYPVTP